MTANLGSGKPFITTWYQWQEGAEGKKNTKYEKTCLGLKIVF